ncbi:hypothetical protein DERF_007885 [Dermatophagoides farinae]|uniref:Uncharacterized protein n=1 Tax=Dermatophagoides farinae TaxID=6954 RepID=A0A922I220_DERFA|nr:hypothetical protein DERF_007885 [Dermatophagoides farinae]
MSSFYNASNVIIWWQQLSKWWTCFARRKFLNIQLNEPQLQSLQQLQLQFLQQSQLHSFAQQPQPQLPPLHCIRIFSAANVCIFFDIRPKKRK